MFCLDIYVMKFSFKTCTALYIAKKFTCMSKLGYHDYDKYGKTFIVYAHNNQL